MGFGEAMRDVLGGAAYVQQGFEQGRERKKQNALADLAGQYYGGQDRSDSMLGRLAALDPRAAQSAAQFGDGRQQQTQEKAMRAATFLNSLPNDQMKAQAWPAMKRDLASAGLDMSQFPDQYTPEIGAFAQQFAGGKPAQPMNVSPGGSIVDPMTGREIYTNPHFAPVRPQWDSARGGYASPDGFSQITAPLPRGSSGPSALQERINAARAMGASEEEIRAMVVGAPKPPAPKALNGPTVDKLSGQAEIANNTADLAGSFKDAFAGNVVGGSAENLAGRILPSWASPATEGQAEWWQQYDRQKNVIRNQLFGAALTPSEQAAFDAADINPNMEPKIIRANLKMQHKIVVDALKRKAGVWLAQGVDPDAVDAATATSAFPGAEAPAAAPSAPGNQVGQKKRNKVTGEVREWNGSAWVPSK